MNCRDYLRRSGSWTSGPSLISKKVTQLGRNGLPRRLPFGNESHTIRLVDAQNFPGTVIHQVINSQTTTISPSFPLSMPINRSRGIGTWQSAQARNIRGKQSIRKTQNNHVKRWPKRPGSRKEIEKATGESQRATEGKCAFHGHPPLLRLVLSPHCISFDQLTRRCSNLIIIF